MCQSRPNCEVHVERGANRNGFRITAKGTSCMPRDVQFSLVSNSNKDKGIKNSKTFKPLTKINATKRVYANDAFQVIAEVKTQDYFTIKFDHGVLSDHCSKIVGLQLPSSPAAELHNNFDEDF